MLEKRLHYDAKIMKLDDSTSLCKLENLLDKHVDSDVSAFFRLRNDQ